MSWQIAGCALFIISWQYIIESCYYISLISILWTIEYILTITRCPLARSFLLSATLISSVTPKAVASTSETLLRKFTLLMQVICHLVTQDSERGEGFCVLPVELFLFLLWLLLLFWIARHALFSFFSSVPVVTVVPVASVVSAILVVSVSTAVLVVSVVAAVRLVSSDRSSAVSSLVIGALAFGS